ncbi:MAG: hypothetical protein EXQ56_03905 [Acidobacteria bacterium]|nr:hypothetical protein [Acidobacteriota bacterium]
MNKIQTIITVTILASGLMATAARAQDDLIVYRPWSGILSSVGKEMGVILKTGSFVRGRAVAIRGSELEIDVKKTSDPQAVPKGKRTFARESILEIELYSKKSRGSSGVSRAVVDAGRQSGMLIGGRIGSELHGIRGVVTGAAVGILGGVIGGVLLDRRLHRETETLRIRIVPEVGEQVSIPQAIQEDAASLLEARHR